MAKRGAVMAIAVLAALALAACGGDDGNGGDGGGGTETTDGGAGTGSADITISGLAYDPATLEVEPGATITISNEDSVAHTFTTDDDAVDEDIGAGETVEVTLEGVDGEVGFHCEIHPAMTGTLTFG